MGVPARESRIRVVLLTYHGLFRGSLSRVLTSEPGLEIMGECDTSADALEVLQTSEVDIVLLDFDLGADLGNDFIAAARQIGYPGRFLIVVGSEDVRNSAIALKLGASGIFMKSETPDRLVQAIRLVGSGGIWVDQEIIQTLAGHLINHYPQSQVQGFGRPLNERERDVLLGIVKGLSNRKIGDNMGLSESSVKNVVQQLFGKAGVRTRSQLVRAALEGTSAGAQELIKRQSNENRRECP